MVFYIGLGGIGCRALRYYAEKHAVPYENCFYMDIMGMEDTEAVRGQRFHGVRNLPGTVRNPHALGRAAALKELYCGEMAEFFRPAFEKQEVRFVIFTSSFGGFGGAVAAEIMDYLQANAWQNLKGECCVYAVTEKAFRNMGFPKDMMDSFELNTTGFVRSFLARLPQDDEGTEPDYSGTFCPRCRLWLSDGEGLDGCEHFPDMADWLPETLRKADRKSQYLPKPRKLLPENPEVFISFSTGDEVVRDLFVAAIEKRGHRCRFSQRDIGTGDWPEQIMQALRQCDVFLIILTNKSMSSEHVKSELNCAFERLREGMRIIPFLVEDTEITDAYRYFLANQEMFFGNEPPLTERVNEVADRITELLK